MNVQNKMMPFITSILFSSIIFNLQGIQGYLRHPYCNLVIQMLIF